MRSHLLYWFQDKLERNPFSLRPIEARQERNQTNCSIQAYQSNRYMTMLSKDGGEGKGKAIARPGACLLEGRAWELEPTVSAHCTLPAIPIHSSVSLSKMKVPASALSSRESVFQPILDRVKPKSEPILFGLSTVLSKKESFIP